MNYYNPYLYNVPMYGTNTMLKPNIIKRMFGNINFHSILNGTQRTLNIVNQAIPLVKQVQPILRNARTMFKVVNEFKKTDIYKENKTSSIDNKIKPSPNYSEGPTFFI